MTEIGHLLEVLAAVGRQDNPGHVIQPLLDRFHRLQLVLYDNQYLHLNPQHLLLGTFPCFKIKVHSHFN
jgi:hypothetical protein